MRRVFVIFLILLFPLNVFALSMSVASLPHDHAVLAGSVGADASDIADTAKAPDSTDGQSGGDIDPDEPPSGAEVHYIFGHTPSLPFAGPRAGAFPPHDADRHCHFIAPPIKPPRA